MSLFGSTERSPEAATALVARINSIFLAAGIRFAMADLNVWQEDVELQRLPNGEWRCPFGEAVDHYVPCLHLGLVERLGDLDALTFSCGRCLMLPDHTSGSEQRAGAEGLAALMGLMLLDEPAPGPSDVRSRTGLPPYRSRMSGIALSRGPTARFAARARSPFHAAACGPIRSAHLRPFRRSVP